MIHPSIINSSRVRKLSGAKNQEYVLHTAHKMSCAAVIQQFKRPRTLDLLSKYPKASFQCGKDQSIRKGGRLDVNYRYTIILGLGLVILVHYITDSTLPQHTTGFVSLEMCHKRF